MDWNFVDVCTYVIECGVALLPLGLLFGLIWIIYLGFVTDDFKEKIQKRHFGFLLGMVIMLFVTGLILMVPTHDRILKVKIAKIKNEAITKDNLQSSLKRVDSIIKKLECKYLGCEEDR